MHSLSSSCNRLAPVQGACSSSSRSVAHPHWRATLLAPKPVHTQRAVSVHAKKQSFTSFDDMIESSDLPVLVDFYATWCGPCQIISASLAGVSNRMKDKIRVVKIDTEKYPTIASKYSIQALPTLMLFKEGKPVDRIEGVLNEQQIFDRVSYFLQ